MRIRAIAFVAAAGLMTTLSASACQILPTAGCPLSIVAPTPDTAPEPGAVAPVDTLVIITPGDIVMDRSTIGHDQAGLPSIDLVFNDDATRRLATYTAAHVGEPILVVVAGRVVVAPTIMSATTGGLSIGFGPDAPTAIDTLRPCARGTLG